MAQIGHFDATTVDPNGGFPIIPPGKYNVHIVSSEMRPTKDGTGQYLYLEMEILDGPEQGKKVFERLNLINGNDTTVRIAQQTLSQICHAVGVMSVSDSEQLHARRMVADVRVEPPKGAYRESNRIMGYAPIGGAVPQHSAAPQQTTPASVRAGAPVASSPPWRRSA